MYCRGLQKYHLVVFPCSEYGFSTIHLKHTSRESGNYLGPSIVDVAEAALCVSQGFEYGLVSVMMACWVNAMNYYGECH